MQSRDLLLQNGTYVELGSGSAEFSDALANAIRGTPSFLLVDRKSFKHAHDSRIRESPYCKSVTRIVVDIKDLKLSKVEALQQQDVNIQDNISNNIATATKIVGIAKHLCGAATDISLRCLSGYQQDVQGGVEGAIITVCCHHACSFTSYINPEYLEKHSISQRDFGFLSVLSAWATCWGLEGKVSVGKVATTMTTAATTIGEKRNIDQFQDGEERSDMDNGDDDDDDEEDAHAVAGEIHGDEAGEENCNSKSDSHWSGMDLEHRREFGRRCKRILDLGRALHLQKMGLQVELAYYVPKEMSLENMMLIVKTRKIVD